jgi:nitrogen regulatory protein P-II 1
MTELGYLVARLIRGCGRQKGHTEIYRGAEYVVELIPKIKIEILVENDRTEQVLNAIIKNARTGKIGDGKISIFPIEEVIRIRTGERNAAAI